MIIEYYEESGKQGGSEGLKVDFKKKMIHPTHRASEKFSLDNLEEIQWAIDGRMAELKTEISRIKEKLNLKEVKRVPIQDGYKIISPPSDKIKEILKEKLKKSKQEYQDLDSIELKKILKEK